MTATATTPKAAALPLRASASTNTICVTEVARRLETPEGARHLLPYYLNDLLIEGTEIDFKVFFQNLQREPSRRMQLERVISPADRAGLESYLRAIRTDRFLTSQEEQQIGQVLEIARCRYRQTILQSPLMVDKAVETLQRVADQKLHPKRVQRSYDAPVLSSEAFVSAAHRNLPALKQLLEVLKTAPQQETEAGTVSLRAQHLLGETFILLEDLPLRFELFAPKILKDIQEKTNQGLPTMGMTVPQSFAYLTMVELRERELHGVRELLTNSNLPMVVAFAKPFIGRGIEFEDLVGTGNIGLLEAANRFDWRRGCRFSTVAKHWIDRSIRDQIYDLPKPYRQPRARVLAEPKRQEQLRQLASKLGHTPSQYEAESAKISTAPFYPPVGRLEDPSPTGGLIRDLLVDHRIASDLSVESTIVRNAVSQLAPNEQLVFLERLNGKTLAQIGLALGITKERVRQIEADAFDKVRLKLGLN